MCAQLIAAQTGWEYGWWVMMEVLAWPRHACCTIPWSEPLHNGRCTCAADGDPGAEADAVPGVLMVQLVREVQGCAVHVSGLAWGRGGEASGVM